MLIALFIIHYFLVIIRPVYAQDTIGQSRIHPASALYFLKSVREILELKFAGTTQVKAYRQLEFATRRIREVKSLISVSRQDLIQPTLEKYWYHIQELGNTLNTNDEIFVAEVARTTALHMNILQTAYEQMTNPEARRSVRTTINRLSQWDQKMVDQFSLLKKVAITEEFTTSKMSGCNFLSREASSSALNEVERIVYSERAQKCLMIKP